MSGAPSTPSRIAAARGRVVRARRLLGAAAAASFGLGLVLVHAAHPAAPSGGALRTPPALAAEVQGSSLGGGSISPSSSPPAAATATS